MEQPKLGYLGMGLMGLPMTRRLLEAGYDVTVWNRTPAKAEAAVAAGAALAATPREVADNTDIVLMCLTDAPAVEAVIFGEEGIASSGRAKQLVDFSSIRPDVTIELAARLAAANGMTWVDSPVSGGIDGAASGSLAIMAGGAEEDVELVRPVLAHLSQRVTHMGPTGSGQTTKLVNQVIVACNIAAMAEAVNLARRSGVDVDQLTEALTGGWADSRPFQAIAPRMAAENYDDPLGYLYTMLKDIDTARDVGRDSAAALPMASLAGELLRILSSRGHAESDISTLVKLYDNTSL